MLSFNHLNIIEFLEFLDKITRTVKEVDFNELFKGYCPFCNSLDVKKKSSNKPNVQELSTLIKKFIFFLPNRIYQYQSRMKQYTPEHLFFPPKYEVSKVILKYALTRNNYNNSSGITVFKYVFHTHQPIFSYKN